MSTRKLLLAGRDIAQAEPVEGFEIFARKIRYSVELTLTKAAPDRMAKETSDDYARLVAVVIDGEAVFVGVLGGRIRGKLRLSDENMTKEDSEAIAQKFALACR